ncbi:hypothetical protein SO802_003965, partial [Lithocarpus litseifolius]
AVSAQALRGNHYGLRFNAHPFCTKNGVELVEKVEVEVKVEMEEYEAFEKFGNDI